VRDDPTGILKLPSSGLDERVALISSVETRDLQDKSPHWSSLDRIRSEACLTLPVALLYSPFHESPEMDYPLYGLPYCDGMRSDHGISGEHPV
jgi:hypothetical protein